MTRLLAVAVAVAVAALVCAPVHAQLKFLSVGDWGGQDTPPYYTQVQMQVAQQMGKTAAAESTQFNLGLGTCRCACLLGLWLGDSACATWLARRVREGEVWVLADRVTLPARCVAML